MPPWLPPFLAASGAVLLLWIALGLQRLLAYRRHWARRLEQQLRSWDGCLGNDLEHR